MIEAAALAAFSAAGESSRLGIADHRRAERRIARGERGRDQRAPTLLLGQRRVIEQSRKIELQILGIVGDQLANFVQSHVLSSFLLPSPRRKPGRCSTPETLIHGFRLSPERGMCGVTPLAASLGLSASCRGRARRSAGRRARAAPLAGCGRRSMSLTETKRMMPCGSTMKVARFATPSSLSRMPSAVLSSRLISASREGDLAQIFAVWRQARCTYSLSIERPSTSASRSFESPAQLAESRRSRSDRRR